MIILILYLTDFVYEWKYLGVTVVSGESFSARAALSSYEMVLINQLYSNWVPVLTYGAEAL